MTEPREQSHWIAHVDLDAFFTSCEQRDHPEYRGRPVVVGALPGARGVVAAASYEVRQFGVRSAMPIAEAYRRCPDAVYLRPDMDKYRKASRQIFAILETVTPAIEVASIDEAYLDISGLEKLVGTPQKIGTLIRERILSATGLTASVGIGPNRLIAKLGSESCKPDGLAIIAPDEVLEFLAPMPVSNLRGLGRQTQKKFDQLGIETVEQLRAVPPALLEDRLGRRAAAHFRNQAFGRASAVIVTRRQRKSISKEVTFATDVLDHKKLHDVLCTLAAEVARTTRREKLCGQVVTLKIRFQGFETHTRQHKLAKPTNDERVILKTAWQLFLDSELPDKPVRLIGTGISDWHDGEPSQTDMFDQPEQRQQDQQLLETIDNVIEKFGKGILQIGMPRRPDN